MRFAAIAVAAAALLLPTLAQAQQHKIGREHYREMVARHAAENNLPEALVHRVIMRESKYQPHLTGKGGALGPQSRSAEYHYFASFAVALCEGEIAGIGRVWADGAELDLSTLTHRLYTGSETPHPQLGLLENY